MKRSFNTHYNIIKFEDFENYLDNYTHFIGMFTNIIVINITIMVIIDQINFKLKDYLHFIINSAFIIDIIIIHLQFIIH